MQPTTADKLAVTLPSRFVEIDQRADGAQRQVWIDRKRISIARRFQGIEMRVAVPTKTYVGVVLHRAPDTSACEIHLRHHDPELSVTLWQEDASSDGAEDVWQSWAAYLELPALCGGLREESGSSAPATSSDRRNRGVGIRRRPAFLGRRKVGRNAGTATSNADPELTSYE